MIREAKHYLESRTIARREPLYSANRFARAVGDIAAEDVTSEHLDQMRKALTAQGLSNRTIETTVADVITVVAFCTGKAPAKGCPLRVESPDPHPVDIAAIEECWQHLQPPLKAFVAFAYWTALRLDDALRWLHDHRHTDTISIVASKTRKRHRFPFPVWLKQLVTVDFPFRAGSDFCKRQIRHEIAMASHKAGVSVWSPKELRQRGITEWSRANAMAGSLVHGTGMRGVLNHYIEPLSILESAAPRVRLPACFGASTDSSNEDALLSNFRRLDPAGQGLVTMTLERLAAS